MLEAPRRGAQTMSTTGTATDPAELQADQLGQQIGRDLPTMSVGDGELPGAIRSVAESHLGADLGGTRLDSGAQAHATSVGSGALAITEGSDIRFQRGLLGASSPDAKQLLGHELVHVAQQRRHHATARQRQSMTPPASAREVQGFLSRQGQHMKSAVLAQSPPDVAKLVAPFSMTKASESRVVRTVALPEQPQGKESQASFTITLEFNGTGSANASPRQESRNVTINIGTNPRDILAPAGIEKKAGKDPQRQQAYLLASTIMHEFVHAAHLIRAMLDKLGVPTTLDDETAGRLSLVVAVSSMASSNPKYALLRSQITKACNSLVKFCAIAPGCQRRPERAREAFQFLVTEWAVSSLTSQRFGVARHSPSQDPATATLAQPSTAKVYADILFYELIGHSKSYRAVRGADNVIPFVRGDLDRFAWQLFRQLNSDADIKSALNR